MKSILPSGPLETKLIIINLDTIQHFYPARDTTARKKSMVKSGMREVGKNTVSFHM